MSRILVTGGAGFIGGHVVGSLLKSGHLVMTIDNLSSGKFTNLTRFGPSHFRDWDILDLNLMDVIFHNFEPEIVIHLAAQPSLQTSWKDAPFDAQTNILGTINLLGLCQRYNVKKFIFASTSAVYAPRVDGSYSENSKIGPRNPYGVSKAAAEHYIRISGVPYVILRLGNVYGPRQVPLGENQLIPRALAHIYQGAPFEVYGDGKKIRSFVYVEDVAKAFVKALEYPLSGTFNISDAVSYQVSSVLKTLWELSPYPYNKYWYQGDPKLGELHCVILDSEKANIRLGWSARTSLRAGLTKTVRAWPK